jgi:serine O-acetyltransferase
MTVSPLPRPKPEDQHRPLSSGRENMNPKDIGFIALIAEDLRTHDCDPLSPGFLALAIHRFGNLRMSVRRRVLRAPLSLAYKLAHHTSIALWGIDLPYNARLGRRLRIEHHGAIFVGPWSLGDDVTIRHAATIGLLRRGERMVPIIGNGVEVGPGACIVGGIEIGDGCYVGPNTVVAESLPAGTQVLGVPAQRVDLEALVARPVSDAGAASKVGTSRVLTHDAVAVVSS